MKFISGYAFILDGATISWKPFKQMCIARSTMKSKFIALNKVVEEVEWIQNFLKGILYWPKLVPNLYVHCNSQSIIERVQSNMYNGKSRHICHKYIIVKHLLSNRIISLDYVKLKEKYYRSIT